jgi:hypothetical protein
VHEKHGEKYALAEPQTLARAGQIALATRTDPLAARAATDPGPPSDPDAPAHPDAPSDPAARWLRRRAILIP